MPQRAFSPTTQPTNVTTAGVVVAVPIPVAYQHTAVQRILIVHKAGSAANFNWAVSTDSVATDPALIDDGKCVAASVAVDGTTAPDVTVADYAGPYFWRSGDTLYVQIKPDAGTNNNFDVFVFLGEP